MMPSKAKVPAGMAFITLAMAVFAVQDAMTRILVESISPLQIMTVRLWIFASGAMIFAAWKGRLRQTLRPARPVLQILRASFSALEMILIAWALKYLGLAETHALFASFPLMAALMAAVALGERLDRARGVAILGGFAGALLILRPGTGVFRPQAFLALGAAALFAAYQVAGRMAARHDGFLTSIVQISMIGAILLTPAGLWAWQAPDAWQWTMILAISAAGIGGHLLLVRALEHAPASLLQPFNYFLLAFATLIGVFWFGERPGWLSMTGALIIAACGLFAIHQTWREHRAPLKFD